MNALASKSALVAAKPVAARRQPRAQVMRHEPGIGSVRFPLRRPLEKLPRLCQRCPTLQIYFKYLGS